MEQNSDNLNWFSLAVGFYQRPLECQVNDQWVCGQIFWLV